MHLDELLLAMLILHGILAGCVGLGLGIYLGQRWKIRGALRHEP